MDQVIHQLANKKINSLLPLPEYFRNHIWDSNALAEILHPVAGALQRWSVRLTLLFSTSVNSYRIFILMQQVSWIAFMKRSGNFISYI